MAAKYKCLRLGTHFCIPVARESLFRRRPTADMIESWSMHTKKRNTWTCMTDWFIAEIHMTQSYFNHVIFLLVQQVPMTSCRERFSADTDGMVWCWIGHTYRHRKVRLLEQHIQSNQDRHRWYCTQIQVKSIEVEWSWMRWDEVGWGGATIGRRIITQLAFQLMLCERCDLSAGHVQSGISTYEYVQKLRNELNPTSLHYFTSLCHAPILCDIKYWSRSYSPCLQAWDKTCALHPKCARDAISTIV